jgi:mannose-1-phosphate guanylyltransferase
MKAMMLIAGRGTRLQPLTDYVPKCCLPVAGIPLLHIWLEKLQDACIKDVLLNPSWGAKYVEKTIMSFSLGPLRVTLRPEKEPIGTAQTLLRNADWIGHESFLVIYGDVLTNARLSRLMKTHNRRKPLLTMQTYETKHPEQKGAVEINGKGWMTGFEEKPEKPRSNLVFSGIFAAKPGFLSHIKKTDVDLGTDVFPRVIDDSEKNCPVYHDPEIYFKDIGTIPDYLACQAEWKELNQ